MTDLTSRPLDPPTSEPAPAVHSHTDLSDMDEESGLTKRDRRPRPNPPSAWDTASDLRGSIGKREAQIADRDVIRKLIINAVLILLWYFFSLAISIYNKWMFDGEFLDFQFPLFTTSLHMLVQFALALVVLFFIPSLRPSPDAQPYARLPAEATPSASFDAGSATPVVSFVFWLTRLFPCGAATSLDIGLGNASLQYITLTFLTMCKSSSLAFVLLFAFVFGLESPSYKLVLIIATMTVGVVMMVAGEADFKPVGFILVITSSFFSGFRWGLTQILLLRHPATRNPFATMFFLAPIMFVTLLVISGFVEGPRAVMVGLSDLAARKGVLTSSLLLAFPGCLAFCMTASEYSLLQRTNVVTLSICGIFKEVVTIIAAELVYHDPLTLINLSGLFITMASIGSYNYLKITKMRAEARKEVALSTAVQESLDGGSIRAKDRRRRSISTGAGSDSGQARLNVDQDSGSAGPPTSVGLGSDRGRATPIPAKRRQDLE